MFEIWPSVIRHTIAERSLMPISTHWEITTVYTSFPVECSTSYPRESWLPTWDIGVSRCRTSFHHHGKPWHEQGHVPVAVNLVVVVWVVVTHRQRHGTTVVQCRRWWVVTGPAAARRCCGDWRDEITGRRLCGPNIGGGAHRNNSRLGRIDDTRRCPRRVNEICRVLGNGGRGAQGAWDASGLVEGTPGHANAVLQILFDDVFFGLELSDGIEQVLVANLECVKCLK